MRLCEVRQGAGSMRALSPKRQNIVALIAVVGMVPALCITFSSWPLGPHQGGAGGTGRRVCVGRRVTQLMCPYRDQCQPLNNVTLCKWVKVMPDCWCPWSLARSKRNSSPVEGIIYQTSDYISFYIQCPALNRK